MANYRPIDDKLFWDKVVTLPTGCWIWSGSLDTCGYGMLFRKSFGPMRAHRVLYEETIGPISNGLELDHLCKVRNCVNPTHVEPVTHAENLRRGDGWGGTNNRKNVAPCGHKYTKADKKDGTARRCKPCRAIYMKHYKERKCRPIVQ